MLGGNLSYTITIAHEFPYGHRLMHHEGRCSNLHGHNGRVEIDVQAYLLDHNSHMVMDFGPLKRRLVQWIDDNLDHQMVLNGSDPMVAVLREYKQKVYIIGSSVEPTAEVLAFHIYDKCCKSLGIRDQVVSARFWETSDSWATYQPTYKGEGS